MLRKLTVSLLAAVMVAAGIVAGAAPAEAAALPSCGATLVSPLNITATPMPAWPSSPHVGAVPVKLTSITPLPFWTATLLPKATATPTKGWNAVIYDPEWIVSTQKLSKDGFAAGQDYPVLVDGFKTVAGSKTAVHCRQIVTQKVHLRAMTLLDVAGAFATATTLRFTVKLSKVDWKTSRFEALPNRVVVAEFRKSDTVRYKVLKVDARGVVVLPLARSAYGSGQWRFFFAETDTYGASASQVFKV